MMTQTKQSLVHLISNIVSAKNTQNIINADLASEVHQAFHSSVNKIFLQEG